MADAETQNTSTPALSNSPQAKSAVKKEKKAKNPRAKRSHPPTSEMVNNAIKGLKERGGSSLKAIKKYIAANYKVDAEKVTPFVKKYLKASVATGALMQTKGKGASGSFKLAASSKTGTSKPVKKTAAKQSSAVKTNKDVSGDKKSTTTKAAATQSNVSAGAAKTKYPTKEKKSNKGPTKKPKAPKPKTAKTAAASASPKAKKGAAPKKKILCLGS